MICDSLSSPHSFSFLSSAFPQNREASTEVESSHSTIHLGLTLTTENKRDSLKTSASSTYNFAPSLDCEFPNYLELSTITKESGFLFDGKVRIRVNLAKH